MTFGAVSTPDTAVFNSLCRVWHKVSGQEILSEDWIIYNHDLNHFSLTLGFLYNEPALLEDSFKTNILSLTKGTFFFFFDVKRQQQNSSASNIVRNSVLMLQRVNQSPFQGKLKDVSLLPYPSEYCSWQTSLSFHFSSSEWSWMWSGTLLSDTTKGRASEYSQSRAVLCPQYSMKDKCLRGTTFSKVWA